MGYIFDGDDAALKIEMYDHEKEKKIDVITNMQVDIDELNEALDMMEKEIEVEKISGT